MLSRAEVPQHAIIKKLAGEDVSHLGDFINALSKLSRGARVPLEYISYTDRHRPESVLVTVGRHQWYASPQMYTRDDNSGFWIRKQALPPNSQLISSFDIRQGLTRNRDVENGLVEQLASRVHSMDISSFEHVDDLHVPDETDNGTLKFRVGDAVAKEDHGTSAHTGNSCVAERVIEPALVMVKVYVPLSCMLDGVDSDKYFGTGVIICHSKEMGLVAVDKNTVAISASEVMLSFAAFPIEIAGEVVFLHPVHSYAIIAYDPSALGSTGASLVRAAELLPEPELRCGETVYLVDLDSGLRATSRKSVVTNPYAALKLSSDSVPRYRATNMEFIELDTDFSSTSAEVHADFSSILAGVLTNEHGKVKALWGSFSIMNSSCKGHEEHQIAKGIPLHSLNQVFKEIISGAKGPSLVINGIRRPMPLLRILEVELYPTLLSEARSFGLSNKWIQALVEMDPVRRQVLQVQGCLAGSRAENLLQQGDMVLAVNKNPITCFNDLDDACHALDDTDDKLKLTIWRQGREIELLVGTDTRDGSGTTRAISWCGCLLQYPHPAVRALGFLPEEGHGVYVSMWSRGSPMERFKLAPYQWIVEVNKKPTGDLDTFVDVIKEIQDGEYVCVRTVGLDGETQELTMNQDLHYWPTWELRFDPETAMWHRKLIKSLGSEDY